MGKTLMFSIEGYAFFVNFVNARIMVRIKDVYAFLILFPFDKVVGGVK
jgi:hypothetical protein